MYIRNKRWSKNVVNIGGTNGSRYNQGCSLHDPALYFTIMLSCSHTSCHTRAVQASNCSDHDNTPRMIKVAQARPPASAARPVRLVARQRRGPFPLDLLLAQIGGTLLAHAPRGDLGLG